MRLFVFIKQTAKWVLWEALVLIYIICSFALRKTELPLWVPASFQIASDSLYQFDSVIYYSNITIEENLAFVYYSKCFASYSSILPRFIWFRTIPVTCSEEEAEKIF